MAEQIISPRNLRVLCIINKEFKLHCALKRSSDGNYLTTLSSKISKQYSLVQGQQISYEIFKDESTYQFDIPEELVNALELDTEAEEIFNSLTKGNQRSLIYLVQQPKTIDKKTERALLILERLKQGITSAKNVLKKQID